MKWRKSQQGSNPRFPLFCSTQWKFTILFHSAETFVRNHNFFLQCRKNSGLSHFLLKAENFVGYLSKLMKLVLLFWKWEILKILVGHNKTTMQYIESKVSKTINSDFFVLCKEIKKYEVWKFKFPFSTKTSFKFFQKDFFVEGNFCKHSDLWYFSLTPPVF